MRSTLIGHAGLYIESGATSILCDPWFNGAYYASWFPFPDNSGIDPAAIGRPTYLYISHLHKDHFDAGYLAKHVSKDTTVLLPEFPLDELRQELEKLGFELFVQTTDGVPVDLDGVRVAICTATSPADGPLGDSTIAVDDGEARLLNQNDCRPPDIDLLAALGPYDTHFLQYSGAIWYPMTYRLDAETKAKLGRDKRASQIARAYNYVDAIKAEHVIPFAGPPAFLDDPLFGLNDFGDDPSNIFIDQPAFIEYLAGRGVSNAHLAVPGTTIAFGPDPKDSKSRRFELTHSMSDSELEAVFSDKKAYLSRYQERRRSEIESVMAPAHWHPAADDDVDQLVKTFAEWVEPLLASAPRLRRALGGPIVIDIGAQSEDKAKEAKGAGAGILIDPKPGKVRRWAGEEWEHYFAIAPGIVRDLIQRRVQDWVNELFLSCRFESERVGGYNGNVFSFFKCLGEERMAYLEQSLAPKHAKTRRLTDEEKAAPGETWRCGDYVVERRCPHLGGDLARFGEQDGEILTCTLHGWKFELETGRCLTSERHHLRTERAPD